MAPPPTIPQLTVAEVEVRRWFNSRLADQSVDLARLYRGSRDVFTARLRLIYEQFLAEDPTLMRARAGPGGPSIEAAIQRTINDLARELGERAIQRMGETLGLQSRVLNRYLGRVSGMEFRELPISTQGVLNELTTRVVGGGTFMDRMFHQTETLRNDLYTTLRQSLLNGDDFTTVRRKIHRLYGVDKLAEPEGPAYGSVKVYRNEALRQWNLLMAEKADETGGVEVWWATLDERTTPGCAARHGRKISEVRTRPPRHFNCRCQVLVVPAGTALDDAIDDANDWLREHGWTRRRAAAQEAWAPTVTAEFDPAEHPRDPEGKFSEKPGAAAQARREKTRQLGGRDIDRVEKTERAFTGQPKAVRTKLSKQQVGTLSELVTIEWLKRRGFKDARFMSRIDNFPVDLIHDEEIIEVKGGLISNSPKAQQWRLTIGQPGKKETAALRRMSPTQKARWNAAKQRRIHARKQRIVAEIRQRYGRAPKVRTITTVVDPDRQTVDLYSFEGFHDRIGWNSDQARQGYAGSLRYQLGKPARAAEAQAVWAEVEDEPVAEEYGDVTEFVPPEVLEEFEQALDRDAEAYIKEYAQEVGLERAEEAWTPVVTAEWDPGKHPRDPKGKFAFKGAGRPAAFGRMSREDFPEQSGPPGERLYHTTSRDNLSDIAAGGIKPHGPGYRAEQDQWPDGGREPRVYFSTRPGGALNFSEPDHVLLRVRTDAARAKGLKAEFKDRDYYVRRKSIRPQDIEVMQGDGSWAPLVEPAEEREAGWSWGREQLVPLYRAGGQGTSISIYERGYSSLPWRELPALAVGAVRPPAPASSEAALARGGPDHVLLRPAGRAWEALTRAGWRPVRPRAGVWVETARGFALDAPEAPEWDPPAARLPLDLLERWPALRGVTFPALQLGETYALRAVSREEAEALTLGRALEAPWTFGEDLGVLARQALAARQATDPHLAVAVLEEATWDLPPEALRTVVSLSTGRVLYAREAFPAELLAPYQRVAVLVLEPPGVWAVRPRGREFWTLPGGHLNPGEAPVEAAVREMVEETGVDVAVIRSLGQLHRPWSTTEVFLARRVGRPQDPLTPAEIDAVHVIPLETLEPSERGFVVRHLAAAAAKEVV